MGDRPVATTARWRTLCLILVIFLFALTLRLGLWLELRNHPTYLSPIGDMRGNHEFAVQVVKGTLPPNSYYKAPLYSYFLAMVYWITGIDPTHARLVQIALTSLSPVLTFLIAWRLFDQSVGVIAGLLASVFWTFLFFSTELLDTALATLLYLLLAYLLVALDDRKGSKWLICGVVLGLGAITRPNILLFAPILAATLFIVTWRKGRGTGRGVSGIGYRASEGLERPPHEEPGAETSPPPSSLAPQPAPRPQSPGHSLSAWRSAVAHVAVFTVGCCLPIAPVTLRNRLVGGEWVLIGAYGGLNLYVANNPHSDSKDGPLVIDERLFTVPARIDPHAEEPWARNCLNYILGVRLAESKLGRRPKPGEFATILSGMAKDFIRENPGWFARHAFRRFLWLFNKYEFQSNRDLQEFSREWGLMRVTSFLHFGVVCPFAIVGLVLALSRRELRTTPMLYYVAMLASLAFPAVLFIVNSRFRTPMVHLLVPFAAYGTVQVAGLFRRHVSWTKRLAVAAGLVSVAVLSNTNIFGYWEHHSAHLRSMYLDACYRSGRSDLIDKAFDDLEKALIDDMKDPRPGNVSNMLQYGHHMTQLFIHYSKRGDREKAMRYGHLMVRREPILPHVVLAFVDLLVHLDSDQHAREVLDVVRARCSADHPEVVAGCLLRYGRRYQDPSSLAEAIRWYKTLMSRRPDEMSYRQALGEAETLLAGLIATTQPTATSHQSIRVEGSRE